jgi:formate dehydrogenase
VTGSVDELRSAPQVDPHARRHPGAGRRGARPTPKGRQVEPAALAELRALLGDRPRAPDLLVEHLHLVQDRFGHVGLAHLAALAHEMNLPLAAAYEVATFYAHFDVVHDGERPPPPVTIRVCDGLSCMLAGAERLLTDVEARAGPGVRVLRAPCIGRCERAPSVAIGEARIDHADADVVLRAAAGSEPAAGAAIASGLELSPAYETLARCRSGALGPEEAIASLEAAGLRGMGGAGFPAGRKWRAVRGAPGPRLAVLNADEGEPGTFKDRLLLEAAPEAVHEGALIGAWAVGARELYLYVRHEYPEARRELARELDRLAGTGLLDGVAVHLRRGAGAYICGEESALLESIEGRRGLPRHKPPYPAEVGLFGRPTLINNVETFVWAREIIARGPDWWTAYGRRGRKGLRLFSVSGRVRAPGVKLAPAGVTARELVEEFSGGMAEGHAFRAFLPGGASGGLLPASMADLPLDFGALEPHGCFVGSGALIVLSDRDDLRAVALNLARFFAHESCGQCTPCRVGTAKTVALLEQPGWDEALLGELTTVMADASICGLGQAAMNPVRQILRHFPGDVAPANGAAP